MRRPIAAALTAAILFGTATGCQDASESEPKPEGTITTAVSPCEIRPAEDPLKADDQNVEAAIAHALDVVPDLTTPITPPPTEWDATAAGAQSFAGATFYSICALVQQVYKQSRLAKSFDLELVTGSEGLTHEECAALHDEPVFCEAEPNGQPKKWTMILSTAWLARQLDPKDTGLIVLTALLASMIMDRMLTAIWQPFGNDPKIVDCAAGVWQGVLIAQNDRTSDTTAIFAGPLEGKTLHGVLHLNIGKCITVS